MPQLIPIGIGAGLGLLSGRSKKSTGGQTSTRTGSTTPTWSPEFQPLLSGALSGIGARMLNPEAGTEGIRLNALDRVNRRFEGLPDRLSTSLARRGFGKSGQLGQGLKGIETERLRNLSDVDTQMADLIFGREMQGYSLAAQLLGLGRGSEYEDQSQSDWWNKTPSNMLGGAIGGGLQGLVMGGGLDKLLKWGGGGNGLTFGPGEVPG